MASIGLCLSLMTWTVGNSVFNMGRCFEFYKKTIEYHGREARGYWCCGNIGKFSAWGNYQWPRHLANACSRSFYFPPFGNCLSILSQKAPFQKTRLTLGVMQENENWAIYLCKIKICWLPFSNRAARTLFFSSLRSTKYLLYFGRSRSFAVCRSIVLYN